MNGHYYNEWDKHAAQWLRNLIAANLIPKGDVDERSITDVQPDDLRGYVQCHFFAGIGGWPYALGLAGWPEDRPCWTGSCPCQPFSVAGSGKGTADERHLWPEFQRLIAECRPATVFGEQVASKDGRLWLAGVRADLEALGYACGAADISAAGVGAPHIRQRLYWVADAERRPTERQRQQVAGAAGEAENSTQERQRLRFDAGNGSESGRVGDTEGQGRQGMGPEREPSVGIGPRLGRAVAGLWDDYEHIPFRDVKSRRIKPGLEPLVAGLPFKLADGRTREGASRAALLKGIGNAIVPPLAAEFIRVYMEL